MTEAETRRDRLQQFEPVRWIFKSTVGMLYHHSMQLIYVGMRRESGCSGAEENKNKCPPSIPVALPNSFSLATLQANLLTGNHPGDIVTRDRKLHQFSKQGWWQICRREDAWSCEN